MKKMLKTNSTNKEFKNSWSSAARATPQIVPMWYHNYSKCTFCCKNQAEIYGSDFKLPLQYFSHNWAQLDHFDDKRMICDYEETNFESKDEKQNESFYENVFYFQWFGCSSVFKSSMQFTCKDRSDCILYFYSQIKILKRKSSSVKQVMIFRCTGYGWCG